MSVRYISPLRYPGGKARVAPYLTRLMKAQPRRPTIYAEPFAGGAGAALKLLVDEVVRNIKINDLSPGIAAFWRSVFFDTEQLARRIENAEVSMEEWHRAHAIFTSEAEHEDIDLGYATFFLNRCNRSGILSARPIGGMAQNGNWKIDARFNKNELATRVRLLGQYRRRVQVSQLDARDFLSKLEPTSLDGFVYVDPPYIVQGENLYLDSLSYEDHRQLAIQLSSSLVPWMLTYDVSETITKDLYPGLRTAKFNIAHTAQKQHVGSEYVVFGDHVNVPSIDLLAGSNAKWVAI